MSFTELYITFLLIFGLIYIAIIISYTTGWFSLKLFQPAYSTEISNCKTSVIIPARNEADNIGFLLNDLCRQNVPPDLFEIIVADDHSTDQTARVVNNFISEKPDYNIRLLKLKKENRSQTFKKNAIAEAVKIASGSLIITTDADCRVGESWLRMIISFYEAEKPKMIVGPVVYHNNVSLFQKFQAVEFLSLIAITGGAVGIGKPVMCNGANLAYEKKAFDEVGGFGDDRFASGDDVFLLLKMQKFYGKKSIKFLKNREAIVFTEAKKTVKDFIHQRIRWASKNKGYDINILAVSFTVYMVNLLILAGILLIPLFPGLINIVLAAMILKIMTDIPILLGIITFAKQRKMFIYSVPLIFLYPVYIVITGALGILVNYQWKGRKVSN